ncbi:hypothetical protein MMC07_000422 [Pseudocyphellaria aurata]|nr:hypothetical protein [Pseudocyphellaria aurata]
MAAGDMPSFALTEEEKRYQGEPGDRHAMMAHARVVAQKEQQLEQQKAAWQTMQRSIKAGKGSPATAVTKDEDARAFHHSVGIAIVTFSLAVVKGTEHPCNSMTKVPMAVCSIKQMKLCKICNKANIHVHLCRMQKAQNSAVEKAERERIRREERERKQRELAEAKRYPIEDLEHLQEQRAKAAEEGTASPAEDVPLPEMMGSEESEALATTLYTSDFITHFADMLGLKQGLSFLQLHVRLLPLPPLALFAALAPDVANAAISSLTKRACWPGAVP